MKIELLADHLEILPTLIDWYQSEWKPYYGVDGPGDAKADLFSRCNREDVPIGLVAIEGEKVLGTMSLDLDRSTQLTPSIVGLLVGLEYRKRGIATALLQSAVDLARKLRYPHVYTSTTILGDLLERTGWQKLREVNFLNGEQGFIYIHHL